MLNIAFCHLITIYYRVRTTEKHSHFIIEFQRIRMCSVNMETKKDEVVICGADYTIVNIDDEQFIFSIKNRDLLLNIIQYRVNDAIESNCIMTFSLGRSDSNYNIPSYIIDVKTCKGIPTVAFTKIKQGERNGSVNLEINQWYFLMLLLRDSVGITATEYVLLLIYGILLNDRLPDNNTPFEQNCFENNGETKFQQITDTEVIELFDLVYPVRDADFNRRPEFKKLLSQQEIMEMMKRCNYEDVKNVFCGKLQLKDTVLVEQIRRKIGLSMEFLKDKRTEGENF